MGKDKNNNDKIDLPQAEKEIISKDKCNPPIEVVVCVGSSCHIKGSRLLIKQLSKLINEYKLGDQVTLKGSFCLEHCAEGFNWKIGDSFFSSKDVKEAEGIFRQRIIEPLCGEK